MAHGPFTIREDVAAARLGCDRSFIKRHRAPDMQGILWELGPNRSIVWSENGVGILADLLENFAKTAPPEARDAPGEAIVPPASPDTIHAMLPVLEAPERLLVVTRTNFRNPRVIQARHPDGEIVNVIGVRAELWWPGFLLLARPVAGQSGVWEFHSNPNRPELGRRQPKGRRDPTWPRNSIHHGAA